jgi:hypothetical protein
MPHKNWFLIAFVSLFAACGNGEENNVVANNTANNTTTNNTVANNTTNNTVANNTANNTTVVTNNPNELCDPELIEDIGSMSVAFDREFSASDALSIVSCFETVGEIATDGAHILKLQYPEETTITITLEPIAADGGGTPPRPAAELRSGACGESGTVVFCDTAGRYVETLAANVPYYLVLNGLLASGGAEIEINAAVPACTPNETTCTDGVVSLCNPEGTATFDSECAGDCMGTGCAGDECTAPLAVAPTANGAAVVLAGNRSTWSSNWDAMEGAGCELVVGEPAPATPGRDMFLLVQGVTAGQTVILDAEQSTLSYGFFVIDSCTATSCLAAFEFDSNASNRGEYVAPGNGDVLVAVEAFGDVTDRDFTIEVSLTGP